MHIVYAVFIENTTLSHANDDGLCWLCCIRSLLSEKMKRDAAGVVVVIPPAVHRWESEAERRLYNLPLAQPMAWELR